MLFVHDAATKIDREIIMETKRVEFARVASRKIRVTGKTTLQFLSIRFKTNSAASWSSYKLDTDSWYLKEKVSSRNKKHNFLHFVVEIDICLLNVLISIFLRKLTRRWARF